MEDLGSVECDKGVVDVLYNVFVGRSPEADHPWLGAPATSLIRGLIESEEFDIKCKDVIKRGIGSLLEKRSNALARKAAAVLTQMGASEPRSQTWPDILLAGIEFVSADGRFGEIPESAKFVAELILNEYEAFATQARLLEDAIYFDSEWFVRANGNVPTLRDVSQKELQNLAALMIVSGEAEATPFFQISGPQNRSARATIFGLRSEGRELSIDEVFRRLRAAVRRGILSHWLFDAGYYERRREQAFADGDITAWPVASFPYLDFLENGERWNIRPHPLFCPASYRVLNKGRVADEFAFTHFVTEGQFEELRTTTLFDPAFYRTMHPSAEIDVRNGLFQSLLESFCRSMNVVDSAFSPDFDLHFYTSRYPDVRVGDGYFNTLCQHFLRHGVEEQRDPNPYFDHGYFAQRYPWVGGECRRLGLTPFEYFLLIGRHGGMKASPPLADRDLDVLQAKGLYERRAKDSLARCLRRPLDFEPVSGEDPILSVIVPVHNQASFTARFLELAFHGAAEILRRTGRTLELIVVSNGSTDRTSELLRATIGIKVIERPDALGYPVAANLGAKVAAGELVVIVNNDIEYEPNVFADIVESYAKVPNCGAIGPRILSMDLTVQEIGAFIAGDGSSFGFARGELSAFNAIESIDDVDYASGCFLCMSRVDFEAMGGFDEAFSPGYYEEVDLCFRLKRNLSKRICVDSSVTITHYEHASFMKGRPPAVSHPTILRNRKRLLKKHGHIGARPSVDRLMGAAGVRSLGLPKSRVLVIEDLVPDPRLGSGFGRAAEVLRTFHDLGVAFDVVAINPTAKIDDYEFEDVAFYRNWMPGENVEAVLNRCAGQYSHIWICRTHNLGRFLPVLKAYKDRWGGVVICDTEAVSVQRTIELAKLQDRQASDEEVTALVSAEFSAAWVVDHFISVNARDADFIRSIGLQSVTTISHTVSGIALSQRARGDRSRLLFVGAAHSPLAPNFDGLSWLARTSADMLREMEIKLTCAGYWEEGVLREFKKNNGAQRIDFLGMVSEERLASLYDEAIVALAPTRYAAGIPCKVIEAMLTGVPIVMTELLADQLDIPASERGSFAIAPGDRQGHGFVEAIRRLVVDATWWQQVRESQIAFSETYFGNAAFKRQVEDALKLTGISWAY